MSEHPIVGERILARTKELAAIAPIVRHEHEHWDGTGYPDGLERQRIPVGSRVILACDAYVAMTTARPYRPALAADAGRRRAARRRRHEVRPRGHRRAARPARPRPAAGARPRRGRQARRAAAARAYVPAGVSAGVGAGRVIERRRVGQPRLVEAAVLRDGLQRQLRGLRARCRCTCPWPATRATTLWSVSSGVSAGAQVGTVSAMT